MIKEIHKLKKMYKELYRVHKKADSVPTRFLNFGRIYSLRVIKNKLYKVKEHSYWGIMQSELTDSDLIEFKDEILENYNSLMNYLK